MSRNLATTSCAICPVDTVVLEEAPRPITREDAYGYFDEYEGMLVANARCPMCLALYLAWVDESPRTKRSVYAREPGEKGYFDLSYRGAFNDEPWIEDLPVFYVAPRADGTFRRVGIIDRDAEAGGYFQARSDDERAAQQRWFERAKRAIAENNPPIDDGDLVACSVIIDEFLRNLPETVTLIWPGRVAPEALRSVATSCGVDPDKSDILLWKTLQHAAPMVLVVHLERATTVPLPNGWDLVISRWSWSGV